MSDGYVEEIRKHLSLAALTIQVATKAHCAGAAFCILFQTPIFNDLSKARVSNTCVMYLCTEEGFQTVPHRSELAEKY